MNRWPIKQLDELLKVQNGFAFKSELFNDEGRGLPIIRIRDLARGFSKTFYDGKHNQVFEVETGDFLIGMDGEFRCYRWRGGKALLNQRVCRLQNFSRDLNASYILYGINDHLRVIEDKTAFVTVKHLSSKQIAAIEMTVPPLEEQARIVRLLDDADELRKLRAQASRRTNDLIRAIFNAIFSTNGEWPPEQLGNLCERITVGHVGPMATEYVENGVPFLRGQNIKRGALDLSTVLFIADKFHKQLGKSAIAPGDVVSVRTGKPGVTAVIPRSLEVANCADLIVMTCGRKLNPYFLCEWLNQHLGDKDELAGATGIAQQHFNIGEARKLTLLLPPLPLQKEFAKHVAEIRALEAGQVASGQRLDKLFNSMLHKAFNGEL